MRVHVGSDNPLKAEAVINAFRKVFEGEIIVELVDIDLEIPQQPFDEEIVQGAIERAKGALKDADYGVGIEGGLSYDNHLKAYFSVQFCAIIDKTGRLTFGHGSGFVLPDQVIAKLKHGQTLGRVMEEKSGIKEISKKMGAIGYLTKGRIHRRELTEQAVLMALIPRIRPELY